AGYLRSLARTLLRGYAALHRSAAPGLEPRRPMGDGPRRRCAGHGAGLLQGVDRHRAEIGQPSYPSVPAVRVLRKAGPLDPHDAEALAGGRLHHDPALQAVHDLRAQLLEASHLGGNIVGFDVEVYAAFVADALDLHDGLIGRGLQHEVVAATARMIRVHGPAEGVGPEAGGRLQVRGIAVDQESAEAGVMHAR